MAEHKFENEARDAQKSFRAQNPANDVYQTSVDLFRKGIERNIQIQKHALDAVSQQNAETSELWRTMVRDFPGAETMLNIAEQTVESLVEMRRRHLDKWEEQSNKWAESAKTPGERAARPAHEMRESTATQREHAKSA